MSFTLGCVEQYDVLVASKEGIPLGAVTPSEVHWSRVADGISEATVIVPIGGPDCCGILDDIHTWHHELQIFRDGQYVWSGPIVQITGDRNQVEIVARDLLALLDKRIIHNVLCFAAACGGAPADLTTIGAAIINDAFAVDGHNYILDLTPTGLLGERQYQPGENALNALQEAMHLGLDVAVLGRKIILGASNGGAPFGRTPTLTCDDFVGDVQFEEDGTALATRAIVLGSGFVGVAKAPGTDANGTDPYYGLIEYVDANRTELNTQALVDNAAQAIIASRYPAPTNLIMPANAALNTDAPVTIQDLVPGTITTIIGNCACRTVQADMVLTKVQVDWTEAGETVQVTYGTLGSLNNGLSSIA